MATKKILITGANGEVGHGLIAALSKSGTAEIVAFDLRPLSEEMAGRCVESLAADLTDEGFVASLFEQHEFDEVYHLAALLSTGTERKPELANKVNLGGTAFLLDRVAEHSIKRGVRVKFLFPSSIAVYGVPEGTNKPVPEEDHLEPITLYGVHKLSGEKIGAYYDSRYGLMDGGDVIRLDFRSLRYPGILSAHTMPTGGTSDYAAEMLHAAAKGSAYTCFVAPEARIPFMTMPDAIRAMIELANAPKQNLTKTAYNVRAFAPSAEEICVACKREIGEFTIDYYPHPLRSKIVDSWPDDTCDKAAQNDWGWSPEHRFEEALSDYLIPGIQSGTQSRIQGGSRV